MPSLDTLLTLAGEFATAVLVTQGEPDLLACYALYNQKDEGLIIGCPWNGDEEKAAILKEVKRQARIHKAIAFSFVTEAWVIKTDNPDALMTRPAEHPNRHEYVFAVARDKQDTKARAWQIVRDRPGGSIIALVPDNPYNGVEFAGQMIVGILP